MVEESTHFVERAAGRYLNKRNEGREAWGRSWERQQTAHQAAKQLDEQAVEAGKLRGKAELVVDFRELFALIPDGEGVPISPSKLVELYRKLPAGLKSNIIKPSVLLDIYWGGEWARASVWHRGDKLVAYLVNKRNRVLQHLAISLAIIKASDIYGASHQGLLAENPEQGSIVFPADRFFSVYWQLSAEQREEIFADADALLSLPKPINRIGFRLLPSIEGYGIIGFESGDYRGSKVTEFPVKQVSLEHLIEMLNSEEIDSLANDSLSVDTSAVALDSLEAEKTQP